MCTAYWIRLWIHGVCCYLLKAEYLLNTKSSSFLLDEQTTKGKQLKYLNLQMITLRLKMQTLQTKTNTNKIVGIVWDIMVCLRTLDTSHAHTYVYNLSFLWDIVFPVVGVSQLWGGGSVRKGKFRNSGQICLWLYTFYCCQLRHP